MKPQTHLLLFLVSFLLIGIAKPAWCVPLANQQQRTGFITTEQPTNGLIPAAVLSPEEQKENFDFLCKAIDEGYADFELKSIYWKEIHARYERQLDKPDVEVAPTIRDLLDGNDPALDKAVTMLREKCKP